MRVKGEGEGEGAGAGAGEGTGAGEGGCARPVLGRTGVLRRRRRRLPGASRGHPLLQGRVHLLELLELLRLLELLELLLLRLDELLLLVLVLHLEERLLAL